MRITVDDSCTGCGLCVSSCPEIFALNDSTVSIIVDDVPAELEDDAQQIVDECPAEAIHID